MSFSIVIQKSPEIDLKLIFPCIVIRKLSEIHMKLLFSMDAGEKAIYYIPLLK
jgi:hypothetical protein